MKAAEDKPSLEKNDVTEMTNMSEKLLLLSAPFCQSDHPSEHEQRMIAFRDVGRICSFLFCACARVAYNENLKA